MPQFLLANFTPKKLVEDRLWVTDLRRNVQWPSTPHKTGHARDFYRVDSPRLAPQAVEDLLAAVEDKTAPIVRRVTEDSVLPQSKEETGILLYFVAFLITRTPAARALVNASVDQISQHLLEVSVETPERWDSLTGQMRLDGYESADQLSYEDALRISTERGVRFEANRNLQLGMMLETAGHIMPTLLDRRWTIVLSPSGSLICSDNPVTVAFTRPAPRLMVPGLGLAHTEVTVPLSRHVLLRGVWEDQPTGPVPMNRRLVGHYNTLRALQADRFLFSPAADFPWADSEFAIRLGHEGIQDLLRSQDRDNRPGHS